jgi:hypothetical protein
MKYLCSSFIFAAIFYSFSMVTSYTSLDQMMKDINSNKIGGHMEVKQHFVGPNFNLSNSHDKSPIFLRNISISFKCSALFRSLFDIGSSAVIWPPPLTPSADVVSSYTLDSVIPLTNWYFAEEKYHQNGGTSYDWNMSYILAKGGYNTCGTYGTPDCAVAFKRYKRFIEGKRGMVFGSESPWAEGALIAAGAKRVTTVEYRTVVSDHPKLSYYHPSVLAQEYLEGKVAQVDFAFSFSTFEHDGLGRYGDPVNPFGDLEAIARVHCLLKPGGVLFLGLPIGPDAVVWNAHRIYGNIRLALVLANWEPIDLIGAKFGVADSNQVCGGCTNQPVWVLRKKQLTSSNAVGGKKVKSKSNQQLRKKKGARKKRKYHVEL